MLPPPSTTIPSTRSRAKPTTTSTRTSGSIYALTPGQAKAKVPIALQVPAFGTSTSMSPDVPMVDALQPPKPPKPQLPPVMVTDLSGHNQKKREVKIVKNSTGSTTNSSSNRPKPMPSVRGASKVRAIPASVSGQVYYPNMRADQGQQSSRVIFDDTTIVAHDQRPSHFLKFFKALMRRALLVGL